MRFQSDSIFSNIKIVFNNIKIVFNHIKIVFNNIKNVFNHINIVFKIINVVFNDINIVFKVIKIVFNLSDCHQRYGDRRRHPSRETPPTLSRIDGDTRIHRSVAAYSSPVSSKSATWSALSARLYSFSESIHDVTISSRTPKMALATS